MYSRYEDEDNDDKENRNDHNNQKTDCTVKTEPGLDITNKSFRDRLVFEDFEEDGYVEFHNSGTCNSKTVLDKFAQIKQEHTDQNSLNSDQGAKASPTSKPNYEPSDTEIQHVIPHIKLDQDECVQIKQNLHDCLQNEQNLHDSVQFKQDPADQKLIKELQELYADHEVKEDLALGPVVLQHTGPSHVITNLNPKSTRPYKKRDHHSIRLRKKEKLSHVCKVCNKKYKNKAWLTKHLASHTVEHDVTNDTNLRALKIFEHNRENSIQKCICDVCGKVFESKNGIIYHMRSHNHKKRKYFCDICNNCFSFKSNLDRHKVLHSNKYFECNICYKNFKQERYLSLHLRTHNARFKIRGDMGNICDCGKTFYDKSNFNRHKRIYCTSTIRKTSDSTFVTCDLCNKEFKNAIRLQRHMKEIHTNRRTLICDYCNKTYIKKRNLQTHIETHTGHTRKLFSCKICSKMYTNMSSLKVHVATHGNSRPFACDFCEKKFYYKYRLNAHKKGHFEIALAKTDVICHICNKQFDHSQNLRQHRLFCNEQVCKTKPFLCDVCKKRFTDKSAITRHIIKNHLKMLICDICRKCFGRRRSLIAHIKRCHSENMFLCDKCPKRFKNKQSLLDHETIHTNIKTHACILCDKQFRYHSNLSQHKKYYCTKRIST